MMTKNHKVIPAADAFRELIEECQRGSRPSGASPSAVGTVGLSVFSLVDCSEGFTTRGSVQVKSREVPETESREAESIGTPEAA